MAQQICSIVVKKGFTCSDWCAYNFEKRREMNSNQYEVSFWLKISIRCSVSSLFVFSWIEVKWNSKRYRFRIGYFDWHEIFTWTEFTRNKMNKRRLFGCCIQCAVAFETHCGSYRVVLKRSRNETVCEQNLFLRRFEISHQYSHFSYAGTWKLVNLFVETKNFNYHTCYENRPKT